MDVWCEESEGRRISPQTKLGHYVSLINMTRQAGTRPEWEGGHDCLELKRATGTHMVATEAFSCDDIDDRLMVGASATKS